MELRINAGYTHRVLSAKTGISRRVFQRIEEEDHIPHADLQRRIAGVFGKQASYIWPATVQLARKRVRH